MKEIDIKCLFSRNLLFLRKSRNLTQAQFAEKINYSDKSVSKWETGETIPDIFVFKMIADFFKVSLDDFLTRDLSVTKVGSLKKHIIINLLAITLIWLVSTIVFFILKIYVTNFNMGWLCFIYAIPSSGIISIIFSLLWFPKWIQVLSSSLIVWGSALSVFLTFNASSIWLIFIIATILELMVLLWFLLLSEIKKKQDI